GHVLAKFVRNPKQATLDYLTTTTPQKFGLDLLQWGLALSPGNRLRWFGRRGIREATERYAVDPEEARRQAIERARLKRKLDIPERPLSKTRPGHEPGTPLWNEIERHDARQAEFFKRLGFGDETPYVTVKNRKVQENVGHYFKHYEEPHAVGNGTTADAVR